MLLHEDFREFSFTASLLPHMSKCRVNSGEIYPAESLRAIHTSRVLKGREAFYDSIESNPLTPEQRLSVVQHDDYNMVLAAAGTG